MLDLPGLGSWMLQVPAMNLYPFGLESRVAGRSARGAIFTMSDEPTPRTDAVRLPISSHRFKEDIVFASFARELERENARLLMALGQAISLNHVAEHNQDEEWNERLDEVTAIWKAASPETKQRAG